MRARGIAFLTCAVALLIAAAGVRYWPREPLAAHIPSSTAIFDRNGKLLRLTLAGDQQYRLWTPLETVSAQFIEALLLHEDRHFYRHPGFDPVALLRAAAASCSGDVRVGGSTITMQLARLLYGLNTRSVPGKLEQIARALILELRYSKRDLLEAHLNLMPYGGNIQGVGAASLVYFGKPAARLDLAEALSLVLIPQSPARRAPAAQEPAELRAARMRLFDRWLKQHPRDADKRQYIAQSMRYGQLNDLPFAAPHFTDQILRRVRADGVAAHAGEFSGGSPRGLATSIPDEHVLVTTLDASLQNLVQKVLTGYVRERRDLGIHNAAALLVDYRDLSVRALVGSADFFSADISGQVNGTQAKRSPGSALKPFIYALAIDQGLIHPLTVLKDAPTSFGPFSPENFDGRFMGPITATDALIRSRNVPAVALSAQLARPSLYEFLRSAGISRMASERHYGLALALGGGEVTMEELAVLYGALANRGRLAPLRYLAHEPLRTAPRVLSEESSFMTLEMLKNTPRPDDLAAPRHSTMPVGWKTGTSWGFRDAWTAGVLGSYVLVVWLGNFDGQGNPAFVGIQAAAPLFFRLVDALAANKRLVEPAYRQPPRLARVEVCGASGDLPNAECPQIASAWYIPGVSPIRVSQIHRRVWIDTRTGYQVCPPYDPRYTRSEVFEFWPTDLQLLFAQAGMPRRRPPPGAACRRDAAGGTPPRITSPVTAVTYAVPVDRIGKQPIPLAADADGEVQRLHWFVDDSYVGTGSPGVALPWRPARAGRYLVRAVDDQGRADSRELSLALVR
ncbi:penicillin-binding protein 1C [Steroidobacter denitrificans]|uniref:peptidoglycan glycosyltransferase n=1 Tax=Steroidobacter denitrificans TaxID=465721 RepID=A0A127FEF7_STEDE|nr:penicillin-binding protein 1C [Steroidobacter denitrificans]AMN48248.1 penicillin-binding protein 1C [Steroidobacter denitrificans]